MRLPLPNALISGRAYETISPEQEQKIRDWWVELGGDINLLIIDRLPGSRCILDESEGKIHIGSDVNPGAGTDANSSMRWRAVVAHELRHLQRFNQGCRLSPGHLDEAITSLEACAFPQLTPAIREELIADALQRLYALMESGNP